MEVRSGSLDVGTVASEYPAMGVEIPSRPLDESGLISSKVVSRSCCRISSPWVPFAAVDAEKRRVTSVSRDEAAATAEGC